MTQATGSAWERTAWRAVQVAAWETLKKLEPSCAGEQSDLCPPLTPSPFALAVRLETAFSCLTPIWPGPIEVDSETQRRLIACVIDGHHPIDGIEGIVRDSGLGSRLSQAVVMAALRAASGLF